MGKRKNKNKNFSINKPATKEQIETIQQFIKTYSADLAKQLQNLDLLTNALMTSSF